MAQKLLISMFCLAVSGNFFFRIKNNLNLFSVSMLGLGMNVTHIMMTVKWINGCDKMCQGCASWHHGGI